MAGVLCLTNQAKEKSAYSIAEKALRSADTQKALKYYKKLERREILGAI
ncbi:hypothetical protein NHP194003_01070 [Helicobacter suis]|uniref:Uncharacterized protein n=1 Tax=Helicobacter suis TaxID=104628 RepID=A0A6J4CWJ8_9HELI|nr:hypothetical protein NHP190020_01090 [Helicobacter suis]BCD46903.1 hypothetical protein NHP194003_01070 [Helicobacter suis]BCD48661.1 hypothetical protein NHP194004_01080 [Helicobacter suis]BCD50437.1 hypothetical protein NHP194022_01080 [Helicobacter suis]BCD69464.1 hypothetical protein SNTW_01090 [Helicobacter suis]